MSTPPDHVDDEPLDLGEQPAGDEPVEVDADSITVLDEDDDPRALTGDPADAPEELGNPPADVDEEE